MIDSHDRLTILFELLDREDDHLQAVKQRLLGDACVVDVPMVERLLADNVGIDRLESFGAKFARMQDTLVDKMLPVFLRVAGEPVKAAIDNLERMQRLGLIDSADEWLKMRGLRNRLVHEYFDRTEDLAPALDRARLFSQRMHSDYLTIRAYAESHLGISPANR